MLTYERARELFDYDPLTGVITRRKSAGAARVGQVAGSNKDGYLSFLADNKRYRAHRVAWLLAHGEWPPNKIDHIDRNRSNNALANLRLATSSQNKKNLSLRSDNKSGVKGVHWCPDRAKWVAQIKLPHQYLQLGRFDVFENAVAVRRAAEAKYYGEFASDPSSLKGRENAAHPVRGRVGMHAGDGRRGEAETSSSSSRQS